MLTSLQHAIERIQTLAEELDPGEQAYAIEVLEKLAKRLESDIAWDKLLASPESQAYLEARGREVIAEYEAGETLDGDWGE